VADLLWQLGELRAVADRERELITIHRDTAEREREVGMQTNIQLLMQIKVIRKAQKRAIELAQRKPKW